MLTKTLALIAIVIAAATCVTAASAATLDDLRALGYTVSASSQCEMPDHTWKTVWSVSGFGNSSSFSECDPGFQAAVDSWANPVAFCNTRWQYEHPDQLAAFSSIIGKGWSVSGDQCADTYNVTNPNDGATAYSGSGSGLPGFDQSHGAPPAALGGTAPSSSSTPAPGACLPLCPNPGDTRGGGGVLIPAPAPGPGVVAAPTGVLAQAVAAAIAAPTDTTVDTSSYTVIASTPEETAAYGIIGWLNTPYVTTPLLAPAA